MHGSPQESEGTVVKVDAYNGINRYIAELSNTSIRSLEDVIEYNEQNSGTEGAFAGDHSAFRSGQVCNSKFYKLPVPFTSHIFLLPACN